MKRKILLITMIVAVLACLFAVSANAKTITYEGQDVELVDNLGDPSWYTGTTASKIQDKESIVILKDAEGNMTAYPSYYIFRYVIDGSTVYIDWANNKGVDYSFVNEKATKNYTSGSMHYVEFPNGITASNYVGIWGNTETNVVEVVFPDTVTSIAQTAFQNAKNLKKVTMSKNIKTIGSFAFYGTGKLETVVFPEGCALTTIGEGNFEGCSKLSSINLENCQSLTTLASRTFNGCTSIDKLSLPDSIQTIGSQALNNLGDIELASNYLPKNLTSVGGYFLANCNLKNDILYFPVGVTSLSASYCFLNFVPKTSLTLVFLGEMTNVNLINASLTNFTKNGSTIKFVFAENQHSDLDGKFFTLVDYNGKNGVIIDYADGTNPYATKTGTLTLTFDDSKYNGTHLGKDANNNTVLLADSGVEMIFCGGNTVDVGYYIFTRLLDGSLIRCYTTSEAYDVEGHKTAGIHYEKITVDSVANCGYDGLTTNTCVLCETATQKVVPATGKHEYTVDKDCTTAHSCTVCLKEVVAALTHNTEFIITYENGYINLGTKTTFCTNDSCEHSVDEDVEEIFTSVGYSSPEEGGNFITHTVIVNKEELIAYEENSGKTIEYGLVAAIHTNGKPVVLSDDGEITAASQAAVVKMTNANYNKIEIKLISIPQGVTVNCNAYYIVDGTVNYICGKEITEVAVAKAF